MAGKSVIREATFTRPDNTTAYAANDAVSDSTSAPTVPSFTEVVPYPTRSGARLKAVTVIKSAAGVTNCDFDLIFFHTTITALEDNAAFDISDAEALTIVATVPFANGDAVVSTLNASWTKEVDIPIQCAANSQTLYMAMVMRGAWTPTAEEVFTFKLHLMHDH